MTYWAWLFSWVPQVQLFVSSRWFKLRGLVWGGLTDARSNQIAQRADHAENQRGCQ